MNVKPVKKCVIPIAGYGTRLFPATKATIKALFPIVDTDGIAKPIIQIIIEEAIASGIEEVFLVTQDDQRDVVNAYFSEDCRYHISEVLKQRPDLRARAAAILELGRRITYVIQDEQKGFGHAVYCAKDFVGDEPFLLLLGDHIYISKSSSRCAKQAIDVFLTYGKSVTTVTPTPEEQLKSFGAIQGRKIPARAGHADRSDEPVRFAQRLLCEPQVFEVTILKEKPDVEYARKHLRVTSLKTGMYFCNFGIDVLAPQIFEILEYNIRHDIRHRGEFQLREAMATLMQQDGLYACVVKGERYDIGIPQEFVKTVARFGEFSRKAPNSL
ncbi:TPA: UTP--glucose-1-phosphate uridylyltransferase [Candidatus Poribacteria bacterium]|nr:UTP--glucose-1-phosphate uridylyltransferase [Candidatus Poribacteria bacterium]